jgi:hypothetical protein
MGERVRNAGSRFARSARYAGRHRSLAGTRRARAILALSAALAMSLLSVSVAGAEFGVTGFAEFPNSYNSEFEFPAPGTIDGGKAVGVNGPGSGGASPGDYYSVDSHRIQQFSAVGEVKRLWGINVVSEGPGNADETQSVAIFAEGGTFTLTFGGETTTPIAYNASPAAVESALNALASIGGVGAAVTVSGGPGDPTGSSPYLVTFGGVQANAAQPLLQVDNSGLAGPGATSFVASPNKGGTGREICEPSAGDKCQAGNSSFTSIAVDQISGDVYALASNDVEQYSAVGQFKREFGFDVVRSGPHDSNVNEVDKLTIKATGGTFTLSNYEEGFQETAPIPYNATAAEVKAAIEALPSIGTQAGGSVTVTGGPGNESGSNPYELTFGGVYAGDDMNEFNIEANALSGPGKSATIRTTQQGGAPEVCTPSDVCRTSPPYREDGGAISGYGSSVGVAPEGAPNAGNIFVAESKARVEEFGPGGNFIRAFGYGVIASGPDKQTDEQTMRVYAEGGTYKLTFEGQTTPAIGYEASPATVESALNGLSTIGGAGGSVSVTGGPGGWNPTPYVIKFGGTLAGTNPPEFEADSSQLTGQIYQGPRVEFAGRAFEICSPANGDSCRSGEPGSKPGQFSNDLASVGVDSSGDIYVLEAVGCCSGGSSRIERFVANGSELTPEPFGKDEVQKVTVNAGGGSFKLGFVDTEGVKVTGSFSNGFEVTEYTVNSGTPKVGLPVERMVTVPGNRIASITPSEIRLRHQNESGCGNCYFTAPEVVFTGDIPAGATAAEVETALNSLPALTIGNGSVSVTGGPGDAGGTNPYVITFNGGGLAGADVPQMVGAQGSTPLSGGSGTGANEASVETSTEGGPQARVAPGSSEAERELTEHESPLSMQVDPSGNVFVVKAYPAGWGTCENGLFAPREARVQEYDSEGNRLATSKPCANLQTKGEFGEGNAQIAVNNANGEALVYDPERVRLRDDWNFSSSGPCCYNGPRMYKFGDAGQKPTVTVEPPSNISANGATISGTINPNGPAGVQVERPAATTYRVEYKTPSESAWTVYAPDVSVGSGTSAVPFSVGISGLTPKAPYEARVVVTKPFGFEEVVVEAGPFKTLAAPPRILAVSSDHISRDSADLHALVNPLATETTVHFEYGPTPSYGESTPDVNIGEGLNAVEVPQTIDGLEPTVYHFRAVATNALGTVYSTDQTFNFYPESCPNATVRQQTGSGSLPECRAYELVSPGNAGASSLLPGGPNTGEASAPARFAFYGALGSIPGPWNPPNTLEDMYVATRTESGWRTHYVGIPGEEAGGTTGPPNGEGDPIGGEGSFTEAGRVMASSSMDRFIGWNPGQQGYTCCGLAGSMAPYVFDAEGHQLGRWPTNVGSVEGGLKDIACWSNAPLPPCGPTGGFVGDEKVSADFSHYFFSSGNVAFAPGGLTSGMGSAYDDNIATGEVTIVSKTPLNQDIPREPGVTSDDYLAIPGAARDGSSVLMAASGTGICGKSHCEPMPIPCGGSTGGFEHNFGISPCPPLPPSHLYMRVHDAVTYDVSQGHLVDFKAMSEDGKHVFFESSEHLTTEDNDNSVDLFEWSQETDEITQVGKGEGSVGDTDACNASWIQRCGDEIAIPHHQYIEYTPTDTAVSRNGDVYFYSPEQFVGSKGIPGRRNLYVLRNGTVQYVATLEPGEPATRIEVTPDGEWAAFITASQLTTYENEGNEEMYRYNAETEDLRCVSCDPTGVPPNNNVEGSQDGLFLTNDGRVFFATRDALVPQDTDGITDIYEYTEGRPQLISTGVSHKAEGRLGKAGLVGVSRDGVDVYFSTFETLVPEDLNGAFLKFYDARTNGGFAVHSVAAPCAAADECHCSGNAVVTPPRVGSTAHLGGSGNLHPSRHHRKKHHRKKHRRHHRNHHKKKSHRHAGNGNR